MYIGIVCGHNWTDFAHKLGVLLPSEFKLPYLKTLRLSIRVEVFELIIVLRREADEFLFFIKSIYLRNRSFDFCDVTVKD